MDNRMDIRMNNKINLFTYTEKEPLLITVYSSELGAILKGYLEIGYEINLNLVYSRRPWVRIQMKEISKNNSRQRVGELMNELYL